MATRMQQRKGTAAQWVSTNNGDGPILNAGEIGYESDTNKFKIGDGINHWVDLNYFADVVELGGNIDDYVPLTQKGAANGVATLNSSGVIPSEQIPSLVGLDSEITTAVDNAINALVDGAPAALNTLNELAAAVNDNSSFAAEVIAEINTKQDIVTGVSDTEIGYLNGVSSAIQTQIDTITTNVTNLGTNKADASTLAENVIDTMAGALTEGTDIVITHNDVANTITIAAGTGLATNTELADAVSNHSNDTTDVHGITDTAELATKTFAANLLVNATKTNIQITGDKDGISIVAENGVADSTTDNLSEGTTNKYYTDARVETKLSNSVGSGLVWDGVGLDLSVDETEVQFRVADVSDIEIGYLNGVTSSIQDQIDSVSTSADAKLPISGGTMTGAITLHADPSSSLHAATKQYVDNTASGIVAKPQVLGATTANIDATYNNGTAGVGATLTHNTNGAFPAAAGGASGWAVGKGILVKNQTNKEENGRYYVSDMGSVSTPYVLTRCSYCDEASEIPGAYIFVQDGTFAGTGWIQVVADPATFTVGTDDIDVFQFSGSGTITAGNGITVSGNEVSIDTAVTQARVENVSDTEIGYLNGVTSAIQTQIDAKANSLVSLNPQTSNYTLVLADAEKMVEMNIGSANTLTVPANSGVAIPVGTRIHVVQTGSGQTTITAAGGVTVNGTPGLKTRAQWSAVTLVKRATDTWVAFGDLTA